MFGSLFTTCLVLYNVGTRRTRHPNNQRIPGPLSSAAPVDIPTAVPHHAETDALADTITISSDEISGSIRFQPGTRIYKMPGWRRPRLATSPDHSRHSSPGMLRCARGNKACHSYVTRKAVPYTSSKRWRTSGSTLGALHLSIIHRSSSADRLRPPMRTFNRCHAAPAEDFAICSASQCKVPPSFGKRS